MKNDPITSVKIDNMNSFLTQTQRKQKQNEGQFAQVFMVFSKWLYIT